MKKIFFIMTLFLVICVNILASPLDFFKSYPNGSIKLDIKWENNELYYNSYFYNASYNEINPKKNWDDFKTIGLLSDIHNTLNKNYSNKNMTASISLSILEKDKLTITSKYYNSNNIIQKEIVEDKFVIKIKNYDEYGNLLGETEKNEKKNTYYVKTYDKNLKSYTEMEVLFNKNEINFKGKKNLGYNVSDSYVMESHYVIKNLNQKNLKKILSNLSSNNYEDVINGYEKIYDNSYSFKYKEKTYKNGKLIDTKEYDSSNINADTFKNISKNEVQNSNNNFSNNSNEIKGVSLNKNDNSSENNSFWYYCIGALVIVIIILGIYRLLKVFPKTKHLSSSQQIRIFQILMKYNENDRDLFSARRTNGIGTGYYRVRSMIVGYDKVYIYAKVFSILFMPTPIILGYLLCYDKKHILASFSEETFSKAKKEIEETVLFF